MAAGDLCTLADVRNWLTLTGTTDDTLISAAITSLSDAMQTWMNRQIASQSYTEQRDGVGSVRLSFANYPVSAVASLSVDGISIPPAATPQATGFYFNTKQIFLNDYSFTKGFGNILMIYTAGYAAVPPELKQAAIQLVSEKYKERQHIGQKNKIVDKETLGFDVNDFPAYVKTMMNNYKKVICV